jgi:hypothetical protein
VNWRIVTTNKRYGGLGIRDIKLMNYALITKWMWLWMKSDKWWKEGTQALDETYTPWEDRNASRFWKNIAKIKEAFICSILYKVGNGKCIIFWQDCWMDEPLQRKFPDLFANVIKKDCTIQELHSTGIWEIHFEKPMSQKMQIQNQQLRRALAGVTLQSQTQDQIHWNRNVQGFSIKSVYQFLQGAPLYKSPVSNIWKLPIAPRINVTPQK